MPDPSDSEQRVLVLAPTGRDAANSVAVLGRVGLVCVACRDMVDLCRELAVGAAVVLLTEESLALDRAGVLAEALARQPTWSDLPVIMLTRGGPESPVASRAMQTLGNVILLERPIRMFALVSAAKMARRARNKQYQLRAQLDQLRQADARKDEFLATLAHELRNPLAPVRTGLHVLKLAPPGPAADPRDDGAADRPHGPAARRPARPVADQPRQGRAARERVELPRRRRERARDQSPGRRGGAATPDRRLPDAPVWLHADLTRLAQVVGNVLLNAAKYTPDGGEIGLVARVDGDEVVISRDRQRVGHPRRAAGPRVRDVRPGARRHRPLAGGLGIGLALVKYSDRDARRPRRGREPRARAREHVHACGCRSRTPVAAPQAAGPPRPEQVHRRSAAVLVVDDNVDGAEMLAMMLELAGHETRVATTGPGASRRPRVPPRCRLPRHRLPGMDGYELARRLRDDPAMPATRCSSP
jgi:signal transduction histidine kinase